MLTGEAREKSKPGSRAQDTLEEKDKRVGGGLGKLKSQ